MGEHGGMTKKKLWFYCYFKQACPP